MFAKVVGMNLKISLTSDDSTAVYTVKIVTMFVIIVVMYAYIHIQQMMDQKYAKIVCMTITIDVKTVAS